MTDLFTVAELASLIQGDVDTSSATLARELATAVIEEEAGPMSTKTSTVDLPIDDDCFIRLSVAGPVTAVTAVEISGSAASYEWQKPYPRLRLLSWNDTVTYPATWRYATVTLQHGWPIAPKIAKTVGLELALRLYTNPEALTDYRIDDHSAKRAIAEAFLSPLERAALDRLITSVYVTGG